MEEGTREGKERPLSGPSQSFIPVFHKMPLKPGFISPAPGTKTVQLQEWE